MLILQGPQNLTMILLELHSLCVFGMIVPGDSTVM